MSDVINVNISDAAVEICCQDGAVFDVLWQDEVNLNLDLNLMYIKSGQAEIQSYVNNVSKPEIDAYLNTQAEPIVADVSSRIVTPLIDDYVTQTSKPELDAFVEAKKPELQAYVSSAQEQANLATEQAETAVAAKNESASLAENAQASASAAEQSSLSAAAAQNNAAASSAQAQEFAEQASSASAGKANVDLDNLSSVGIAKFNAKQNTITGAATTIASTNLTGNRALISNASGKVAVSAVTSTELGYLDGVTSSIQTQLNAKAKLASPAFSGTPTAPTQASTNNSTRIATTAFVNNFFNTAGKVTTKCMPNYAAGVSISSNYTVPSDGFIFCGLAGNGSESTTINGKQIAVTYDTGVSGSIPQICAPVSKGDVFKTNSQLKWGTFFPCKGA